MYNVYNNNNNYTQYATYIPFKKKTARFVHITFTGSQPVHKDRGT